MTTRAICQRCQYPQITCVCAAVKVIDCQSPVDILQHPSEQKAAKNTARLVALCVPTAKIWLGESEQHFAELKAELGQSQRPIAVLYPGEQCQSLPAFIQSAAQGTALNPRFIMLDGTWKKAYKLWQLNPWLWQYPRIALDDGISQYHIRKAPKLHHLSTLEAVAHCLSAADHCDVQPLYDCLHKMQASFKQHWSLKTPCN